MRLDVLLVLDDAAVTISQVAVVVGAHMPLLAVDAALLVLELCGLATGKLAAVDALRNAVLLVVLALVDIVWRLCQERGRVRARAAARAKCESVMGRAPGTASERSLSLGPFDCGGLDRAAVAFERVNTWSCVKVSRNFAAK